MLTALDGTEWDRGTAHIVTPCRDDAEELRDILRGDGVDCMRIFNAVIVNPGGEVSTLILVGDHQRTQESFMKTHPDIKVIQL